MRDRPETLNKIVYIAFINQKKITLRCRHQCVLENHQGRLGRLVTFCPCAVQGPKPALEELSMTIRAGVLLAGEPAEIHVCPLAGGAHG